MLEQNNPASAGVPSPCLAPLLSTSDASKYLLCVHGIKRAPATLAKMRSIGGGPKFVKFNVQVYYSRFEIDEWVAEALGKPKTSTSE